MASCDMGGVAVQHGLAVDAVHLIRARKLKIAWLFVSWEIGTHGDSSALVSSSYVDFANVLESCVLASNVTPKPCLLP
jgi:hypothetical protein